MISSLIIGSCIDRNEHRQYGSGHVKNNEELGNEIMSVLNLIKDRIENKLNVDFNLLQCPIPVNLIEDDEEMTNKKHLSYSRIKIRQYGIYWRMILLSWHIVSLENQLEENLKESEKNKTRFNLPNLFHQVII